METQLPHVLSMIGQLKTLAYFKNKFGIGLLWLFKSRQIVSATIYFFVVIELPLPEADGLKQRVPAVSRPICVYASLCILKKKKRKDFQQALNRNCPHRKEHICDARISARGNPDCPPALLAQLNGRNLPFFLIWPSGYFLKQYVVVVFTGREKWSLPVLLLSLKLLHVCLT